MSRPAAGRTIRREGPPGSSRGGGRDHRGARGLHGRNFDLDRQRRDLLAGRVIGGGASVAGALSRARDYDPSLFARIDAAWRVGPDVVFEVGGRRLWFGAELTAEDIRAVTAVEQALARQGRSFEELDGRFTGQVIVRRSRA